MLNINDLSPQALLIKSGVFIPDVGLDADEIKSPCCPAVLPRAKLYSTQLPKLNPQSIWQGLGNCKALCKCK